jgi:hypothetical protein
MTSRQHQNWINKGRHDDGLAKPLAQLRDVLRAAGYTVYDFPNTEHLDHMPPEDHTPFSETGWPQRMSPQWWRHAIDIMPPSSTANLPSLQWLGQRIFDDRQAGRITWLKYMNWPSTGKLDEAVQDGWNPNHYHKSSGDTGHIHLSSVTGCETLNSPYYPLSTLMLARAFTKEDKMFLAVQTGGTVYLCDGMHSRPLTGHEFADLRTLINEGLIAIANSPDHPRGGWYEGAFGSVEDTTDAPPALFADSQIQAIADRISTAVVGAVAQLSDDDKPAVADAVRRAMGDTTG